MYWKRRIRRETDLEGNPLVTFAAAHALMMRARDELKRKVFDPEKWETKAITAYAFETQVSRWYDEKVSLMEQGRRAPSSALNTKSVYSWPSGCHQL